MARDLTTLHERHRLAMLLDVSGYKQVEIARILGCSTVWLSGVQQSPLYQAELGKMRNQLHERLLGNVADRLLGEAEKSLNYVAGVRDDHDAAAHLRLRAARDLLDRAPRTARVTRQLDITPHIELTDDQLKLLTETLQTDPLAQHAVAVEQRKLMQLYSVAEKDRVPGADGERKTSDEDAPLSSSDEPSDGAAGSMDDLRNLTDI
jgi:hypothetical protein